MLRPGVYRANCFLFQTMHALIVFSAAAPACCCQQRRGGDQVGSAIRMHAVLAPGKKPTIADEVVMSFMSGTGFAYSMKPYPLRALRSMRSHSLVPSPDGRRTVYRSYFCLAGWLAPLVRCLHGTGLHQGFHDMTFALRNRAEAFAAAAR